MPQVDRVLLVRHGQPQHLATETISREEARALKKAEQGYFADSGRVFHVMGPLAQSEIEEIISYAAHELASNSSLSDADMLANVGLAKRANSELRDGTIKRAQAKVKAWISPLTADEKSPIPRGRWYASERIQVTATA